MKNNRMRLMLGALILSALCAGCGGEGSAADRVMGEKDGSPAKEESVSGGNSEAPGGVMEAVIGDVADDTESAGGALDEAAMAESSVMSGPWVSTDENGVETGGGDLGTGAIIGEEEALGGFYITEITDELFERIYGLSFKEDCTLPREDLRYLHLLHKNLEGETLEGEMIVNRHIAEDVLDIFKELYEAAYPIEKIRLVDEYGADDELSMEDNNSSCFNFRFVPRTTRISMHGLGLAVDINTLYNPYITRKDSGELRVEPVNAEAYADREGDFPYKIERGDLCFRLFTEKGFEWGGDWKSSKDYQHFEIPDGVVREWYP